SVATTIPNPTLQHEFDDFALTRKLSIVQPLAWLARRPSDAAAGRAFVARGLADSVQAIAELGRDVRHAFYGALAAGEIVRLSGEQVAAAESLLAAADRRLAAGDIAAFERDQVAQDVSLIRLSASRARSDAGVAQVELRRAIVWDPAAPLNAVGALDAGVNEAAVATRDPVVREAVQSLPALRSALADSLAAVARLRGARIAQIPIPGVLIGREWGGDAGNSNAILGFAVPVPLWSFGREAVAQAKAAAAASAAHAAEARLTIDASVAAAHVRLAEAAARARTARDSLRAESARIRAGAVRLYEEGRSDVTRVLEALRAERDVGQTIVRELLEFQLARADLLATLGQWQ
ncbi:MAG TPA: TolC family protein, partial [Gemmatimonadaceae bacterium]|nr:TolC family protein [Gemmatimonadaceae bacterium]